MRRTSKWQIQAEQPICLVCRGTQQLLLIGRTQRTWIMPGLQSCLNEEPYLEMWAKGERCKQYSTVLRKTDLDVTDNKEVTVWSSSQVTAS